MKSKILSIVLVLAGSALLLGACQSAAPPQAPVATFESLPAAQRTAVVEQARAYVQSLSPEQKEAIRATMTAAQAAALQARSAGAPAPQAASAPGLVSATQQPSNAPIITSFFASAPSSDERAQGVAYFLNYDTVNATRVEIAGYVMDNPQTGRWPVWGTDPNAVPTEWSIWASNDVAWVDEWMRIDLDSDLGTSLQPITVNNRSINLSLRDPQYVDGDTVELRVNGVSYGSFVLDGRPITFPFILVPGQNTVEVVANSAGTAGAMIAELSTSNVTSGNPVQTTRALPAGQGESLIITAP